MGEPAQRPQRTAAVAFNAESEVYRVRDPKSSRPTNTWSSFTRRWPINGREVQVSELLLGPIFPGSAIHR